MPFRLISKNLWVQPLIPLTDNGTGQRSFTGPQRTSWYNQNIQVYSQRTL